MVQQVQAEAQSPEAAERGEQRARQGRARAGRRGHDRRAPSPNDHATSTIPAFAVRCCRAEAMPCAIAASAQTSNNCFRGDSCAHSNGRARRWNRPTRPAATTAGRSPTPSRGKAAPAMQDRGRQAHRIRAPRRDRPADRRRQRTRPRATARREPRHRMVHRHCERAPTTTRSTPAPARRKRGCIREQAGPGGDAIHEQAAGQRGQHPRASARRACEQRHWTPMNAMQASMPIHARPWPALHATANRVAW